MPGSGEVSLLLFPGRHDTIPIIVVRRVTLPELAGWDYRWLTKDVRSSYRQAQRRLLQENVANPF